MITNSILEDWITNNHETIDGTKINPNAISPSDYNNGNYTAEQLDKAQKIFTINARIID